MFGSQLVNEQATWEDILAVLEVMERSLDQRLRLRSLHSTMAP